MPTDALPDEFVPQPVPGVFEGLRAFAGTVADDPAGGLRFVGRVVWMAGLAALYVPLHHLTRGLGLASPWPRHFLRSVGRACGMRVSFTGTPRRDHVFYVGNHLSWIDICALGGITGTAFVAQDRIADWPVFGWLSRLNNTVFVSRTDKMQVGRQIDELRSAVARHRMLALFPEGTTTDGRSLLPFKAPLFAALDPPPPEMLIQPLVMDFDDAGKDLAWIGVETAPANAWRVLRRRGTFTCTVHFLTPFDPATIGHRKAVTAECRRRIAAKLSETLGGAAII
jgi:1-acyl-sn-glycerol-3-phosphate acyltransferase